MAANVVSQARGRKATGSSRLRAAWEVVKSFSGAFLIYLVVNTFLIAAYRIPSGSMIPTLLVGDWLFVNKAVYGPHIPFTRVRLPGYREPRRGDVIVFESPYQADEAARGADPTPTLVKRMVGMPGDTVFMRDGAIRQSEDSRHVSVPVKADAAVEELEVRVRDSSVQHVFIDVIARACVNQQHVVLDVAIRQSAQPIEFFRTDHVDGPADHRSRVVIEPFEYLGVSAGAVMVANECQPPLIHDLIDATFRITPVPHHIAETERFVHGRAVSQHRLERVPVGVDVRKDRDLQACFS